MPGHDQAPAQEQTTDTQSDEEQEPGQEELQVQVNISHTDLTVGELEAVQVEAGSAETADAALYEEMMQYDPLPTEHSDYLAGQCDEVMRVWLSITPPCTCSIRQHGRTLGLCRSLHLRWTGSRARDRSPFEQASRRGSYIPLDRGGVFQVVRGRPYGNINHQYQPNRSRMVTR